MRTVQFCKQHLVVFSGFSVVSEAPTDTVIFFRTPKLWNRAEDKYNGEKHSRCLIIQDLPAP